MHSLRPKLALLVLLLLRSAHAAPFPFVLPWDDTTPTVIDVSFLNVRPAGRYGFIAARDGHFVESKTGRRVRFLGVVLTFTAPFPTHEDAAKTAARLAKFGVNVVRIHYIDHIRPDSIWDPHFKDHRHLDAGQMERFDYFIAQLKQRGIYANINLHVARTFTPEDGFPESVKDIPFEFHKRVDYFDRRMIELQKEYAHDLLSHVNPYTKTAYADEPAVLCVEINNENSLTMWDGGAALLKLPEPFRGELAGLWNAWLRAKYPDTAALQTAWFLGIPTGGGEMLPPITDAPNWERQLGGGANAKREVQDGALKVEVAAAGQENWHAQLVRAGLNLEEGHIYTLKLRAKADAPRPLGVSVILDQPDWHVVGTNQTVQLGPEWQEFEFVFEARNVVPNHARVSFPFGTRTGTLWLADVSLKEGAAKATLAPGQTLETATVPLPVNPIRRQKTDWLGFLLDTELAYAREMRDYLKNDLKLHSLVTCSQVDYGAETGILRENEMDYINRHAYWDHPQMPDGQWLPVAATMNNRSMIPGLGQTDTLTSLAKYRVDGKPYSISEYNHPAPNEYRAECLPLLASVAAYQDWDALYLHEYGWFKTGGDANDRVQAYFVVGSDPAKWAFMPAAALLFRAGVIAPATSRALANVPDQPAPGTLTIDKLWQGTDLANAALSRRLALLFGPRPLNRLTLGATWPPPGTATLAVDKTDPKTARYTADAPAAKVVAGFVAGQTVTLKGATFTFGETWDNFAALTLTALDQKPLASAEKSLLTLVSRIENTGQTWQPERHNLTRWGTAPTLADGVPVTVQLTCDAPRHVWALDATGTHKAEIAATFENGTLRFAVDPAQATLWYSVEK